MHIASCPTCHKYTCICGKQYCLLSDEDLESLINALRDLRRTRQGDGTNMAEVSPGMYVVRTQAGFKQALRHYVDDDVKFKSLLEYPHNYPTSYPSLVSISIEYRGYEYFKVNTVHLNSIVG